LSFEKGSGNLKAKINSIGKEAGFDEVVVVRIK